MKIVKFNDGTYAIRKRSIFLYYVYYDFSYSDGGLWWSRMSSYYHRGDCKTSLEYATKIFNGLSDKGTPISQRI